MGMRAFFGRYFGGFWGWIKRHPIWTVLIALFVAMIGSAILVPSEPTYAYVSEAAADGEIRQVVSASGKVRALNTIKVGAEVSGQITNVYVDFNSAVTRGQVLAEIDATRPRAQVQQAEAQVATARAALASAEAALIRARTDITIQSRDYARRKSLQAEGFVSKAGLDQAESALAAARGGLGAAEAQVTSARAQIQQASAQLSSARLELNRTVIVAPASGTIINKLVEPGATVAASFQTPNLFEIAADTSRMQIEAQVDEADIGRVREGQAVRFTVDSYANDKFEARVRQIRKAAVETGNVVTYLVVLDVDNLDGKLLPGMTANVEIETGSVAKGLRIPVAATRFRPKLEDRPTNDPSKADDTAKAKPLPADKAYVYVATADPYKPAVRTVTFGLEGEDFVEIKSGLKAGDKVILRSRSLGADGKAQSEDEPDDSGGDGED
jgi:HlyD family secretion protein